MPKPTQLMIIVIGICLLLLSTRLSSSQNVGPTLDDRISKINVIKALKILKRQDPQGGLIKTIRSLGVDFETTPEIEIELRKAGATLELIEAVKESYRPLAPLPNGCEDAQWENIKSSKNPEDYRRYLRQYPDGKCVKEAQVRLQDLAGTVVLNGVGMELVWIPPGSFPMGSDTSDTRGANEKPPHQVTFSDGFYLGRFEVTIADWRQVMKENMPTDMRSAGKRFMTSVSQPVVRVSRDDAKKFVDQLNLLGDGYEYGLPSEAKWEYACLAGAPGNSRVNLRAIAWYESNSKGTTHPVTSKDPNPWGLYHMNGNVYEWCLDSYHENYNDAPTDGSAWVSGENQEYGVMRGGSWRYSAADLRCANRRGDRKPDYRSENIGFRVMAVARTQ